MAERGKTIICSVLFLDIAEYSRKSVSGQISLKERFNAYLSVAIRDVPIDDRIILDTGDGAALSFLGDVGDALQVALSMRESLREGLHMEPPLLVRMGINLGPVRLIRDINGQPNIVGDGINVAQRVMGFADPGQILVSRPYYDAVSRLSPEYAGMFHYQGSRTDKHVREHEIYAIGYPGEFTSTLTLSGEGGKGEASTLSGGLGKAMSAFRKASPFKKLAYAGVVLVPLVAVMALFISLVRRPAPAPEAPPVAPVVPASAVMAPVSGVVPASAPAPHSEAKETPAQEAKEKVQEKEEAKEKAKEKAQRKKKEKEKAAKKKPEPPPPAQPAKPFSAAPGHGTLSVVCAEGATVYVDGVNKGTMGRSGLNIEVDAGRRMVLVMQSSRIVYAKSLDVGAGKVVKITKDVCH